VPPALLAIAHEVIESFRAASSSRSLSGAAAWPFGGRPQRPIMPVIGERQDGGLGRLDVRFSS